MPVSPDALPQEAAPVPEIGTHMIACKLGRAMLHMLTEKHGETGALHFASMVTCATLPGTVQRHDQNKAWDLLTARLAKLCGEITP